MTYVPLWLKSNHSFLEGASHPEELMERGRTTIRVPGVRIADDLV